MVVRRQLFHNVFEGRHIIRLVLPPDATPARRFGVAALAALAGLSAYGIFTQAAQGSAIDSQVRNLSAQNASLRQQIDQRRHQIAEANNVDWLEEQARRLGFVLPGESLFILSGPGASMPPTGGVNLTLPTTPPSPSAPPPSPTPAASPSPPASASPNPSPTPFAFVEPTPSPAVH